MSPEERLLRLENAFSSLAELAAKAESRADILIELVRSADERKKAMGSLRLRRNHKDGGKQPVMEITCAQFLDTVKLHGIYFN